MKYPHTIIEKDSTEVEWAAVRNKLEALTEEQVKDIAARIGISFTKSTDATKDDYIDILDEAYWDELAAAYLVVAKTDLDLVRN